MNAVRALSHYIYVMYQGQIVEHGPAKQIFEKPENPYTQFLIGAIWDAQPAKCA
jgi:ABC-type dipeptide/oligopeptide/nickel transport system ATPase component